MFNIESYLWRFPEDSSEAQQMATVTCPDFLIAFEKAQRGAYTYDWIQCTGCEVNVVVKPAIRRIEVEGSCPKL